jgi:predicted anti-sigma-YlaC factor YlaD
MLIPVPPSECMSAREAVSGRLDEELPELEATRLEAHLRRCPACREYAAAVTALTAELRRAPLEAPPAPVFTMRPRRLAGLRVSAAAAAVAVAATGSLVLGRMVGSGGQPQFTTSASDATSIRRDSAEQHLLALLPRSRRVGPLRNGPIVPL